jgi:hypothetical protein
MTNEAEFIIDVAFLRHVIHILITHHQLTITKHDIEAIMTHFGEVDVRTKKQRVHERSADVSCCGGSETHEKIIEVIKKVIVQGWNVAIFVPELVSFLGDLGITL